MSKHKSEEMQSSSEAHQLLSQGDHELLSRFYREDWYKWHLCRIYPVNKCRLQNLINSLSS